ncbi:MAG: hypothetical protein ACI4WW_02830, partial [Candidatus Coprovivens sp.]
MNQVILSGTVKTKRYVRESNETQIILSVIENDTQKIIPIKFIDELALKAYHDINEDTFIYIYGYLELKKINNQNMIVIIADYFENKDELKLPKNLTKTKFAEEFSPDNLNKKIEKNKLEQ